MVLLNDINLTYSIPSLQGTLAKPTKPILHPNFANRGEAKLMSTIENILIANKESFRPSRPNERRIYKIYRQCLTAGAMRSTNRR